MNETQPTPTLIDKTPQVNPGNYGPVTVYMEDSLGVIFLGILAVILLIGWRHAETRYRKLINHLEATHGNHLSNTR